MKPDSVAKGGQGPDEEEQCIALQQLHALLVTELSLRLGSAPELVRHDLTDLLLEKSSHTNEPRILSVHCSRYFSAYITMASKLYKEQVYTNINPDPVSWMDQLHTSQNNCCN